MRKSSLQLLIGILMQKQKENGFVSSPEHVSTTPSTWAVRMLCHINQAMFSREGHAIFSLPIPPKV